MGLLNYTTKIDPNIRNTPCTRPVGQSRLCATNCFWCSGLVISNCSIASLIALSSSTASTVPMTRGGVVRAVMRQVYIFETGVPGITISTTPPSGTEEDSSLPSPAPTTKKVTAGSASAHARAPSAINAPSRPICSVRCAQANLIRRDGRRGQHGIEQCLCVPKTPCVLIW